MTEREPRYTLATTFSFNFPYVWRVKVHEHIQRVGYRQTKTIHERSGWGLTLQRSMRRFEESNTALAAMIEDENRLDTQTGTDRR